jgi:hypothetical protein
MNPQKPCLNLGQGGGKIQAEEELKRVGDLSNAKKFFDKNYLMGAYHE